MPRARWPWQEQVGSAAVFSSGVVVHRSDEHLVAGDGDRPAESVTGGRRRVEEGVQEFAGGSVEQVGGAAVFSSGVVVPRSDENLVAGDGDRNAEEVNGGRRRVEGRRVEEGVQESAGGGVEQVGSAAVFSSGVVARCSDEHLVAGDGDRSAEFLTDGRRRVEEGAQLVAGGRVEQVGSAAVYSSGFGEPRSDENLVAGDGDRTAEHVGDGRCRVEDCLCKGEAAFLVSLWVDTDRRLHGGISGSWR